MNHTWPVDENGKPYAIVSFTVAEKIGLPEYSNVDVGPVTVTRCVPDDAAARKAGLAECAKEAEEIAAVERGLFLERLGHALRKK